MATFNEFYEVAQSMTKDQARRFNQTLRSLAILAADIDFSEPFDRNKVLELANKHNLHADFLSWLKRVTNEDIKGGLYLMRDASTTQNVLKLANMIEEMH